MALTHGVGGGGIDNKREANYMIAAGKRDEVSAREWRSRQQQMVGLMVSGRGVSTRYSGDVVPYEKKFRMPCARAILACLPQLVG